MAQTRRSAGLKRGLADPWLRLRLLGGVALVVVGLGTIGYVVIEDASAFNAFYMTLITLTTVGFGEIIELDGAGRALTAGLIVTGVTLVGTMVAFLAQLIQAGGLGERGRQRRMQKTIDNLKGHYIVCGYGRVGQAVCYTLVEERIEFVVVDRGDWDDEDVRIEGFPFEIGDATQESVLRAAGLERARGLVCALPDDPDNVFIALAARSIKPDITIVSRLAHPAAADRLIQAGVDHIVSPYETSGRQMALAALEKS
ncbi:MAG: potassium channel family protein [Actinomycetota bacterium]|nr:potassium channel family protein [Actinomycetota bacterium]